jgi:hypothetical protein
MNAARPTNQVGGKQGPSLYIGSNGDSFKGYIADGQGVRFISIYLFLLIILYPAARK